MFSACKSFVNLVLLCNYENTAPCCSKSLKNDNKSKEQCRPEKKFKILFFSFKLMFLFH